LQITRDLGMTIWGSQAACFHRHGTDSIDNNADRWRWPELMDAAIAFWRRYGIVTGVRNALRATLQARSRLRADQWDAIKDVRL
jgi:hypothetical protein